ncbi:MAG: S8 family serine peptidase, partial [Gammaproteobacteria bacterium]|nr:S8 family serine peptidase [Gammaproteobacteria bacterium]
MNGLTAASATTGFRWGRVVVAGCLFVFVALGLHWFVSSRLAEPESPAQGTPTAESQRREVLEELVAVIDAQSRNGRTPPTVQAPPPRDSSPIWADARTGTAERPSAPEGFAYATFERAGPPTRTEVTGDEEARSQAPAWFSSPDSLAAVAANAEAADRDWSFGWVRLGPDARLEDAEAELAALGVVVEGQAGDLLRARLPGDPDRLQAVAALPTVDGLAAQPSSAKLSAAFAEEARHKPAHEIVPVFVTLAATGDNDGRWRMALERLGAVVGAYDAHTRSYTANVEYGSLEAFAAADFVVFIEPVGIVEAANDTAAPAMGADAYRTYTDTEGWAGTAGQGVAVGVMDSGLNINHLDIESGRLSVCGANFIPSLAEEQDLWVDANFHGTHVTATLAGNGTAERRYAGMAPLAPHIRFAKVLDRNGFGPNTSIFGGMDFLARPSSCEAAGWTDDALAPPIVNMSLAGARRTWEGRDASARKLDAVVWDTGQLYAVANANADVHAFSNYGAAKNSLAVGSAWDSGELAGSSSRGPTADGRLVPLVVGTGVDVRSARGGGSRGEYIAYSGTSMSSPAVAGVAALAMDVQPALAWNPALARAHLMSSAVKPDVWFDAPEAFPSVNTDGPGTLHARFGLGKVSASTSVFDRPAADGWESGGWHGISLSAGETSEHVIDVPADASRLDLVLTWDEPPADVIANTVLNDLDLWLEQPFPRLDADLSSRSRRDNVEWISVDNPQTGRWRPRVVAERVYGDKPRAALAYTIIRGPSTPQLSITANRDTLGPRGDVELTVSTDGYVAAGARLMLECRTEDDEPCHPQVTYEDVPASGLRTVEIDDFVGLGEIRAGEPRTVRVRDLHLLGNPRLHFTVTGWNARGDTAVVFAENADNVDPAAPTNDDFASAADLDGRVEGEVQGDLLTATTEPGEPAFEDGRVRPAASVWYQWTAKDAGPVHFSLTPAEGFRYTPAHRSYHAFEMRVDVYEGGSIAGAREVASAPWGASFLAEQGSDYLVRVASRVRTAPFTLTWRQGGAPDNDAFAAAVALEDEEGHIMGTNAGATLEPGEQFGSLAATVWYQWTAPDDGWYEFGLNALHLKLLVFEDAPAFGGLRLVSGFPEWVRRFPSKGGATYRLAVAARDAEAAGTAFELSWSALGPQGSFGDNDLVENALRLPDAESSSATLTMTNTVTVEPGEPAETGIRTGWWIWTPPSTGEYTWRLDPGLLRLSAFKGDALADLDFVGSNDGPTGAFTFTADQAMPYAFAAAAAAGNAYTRAYQNARLVWGPTPSNDKWSLAVVLDTAAGMLRGSNRFATIEAGEAIHGVGHSSLWWAFEAPEAGWYRFWIDETSLPFTLSVYRDAPGEPPGRLEMVDSSERSVGVEAFLHASAGERFAVRVGTRGDAEGRDFTLRWEATDPPVWLRYAGDTEERYEYDGADGGQEEATRFRSLAFEGSGRALYADTDKGIAVFERSASDGALTFQDVVEGSAGQVLFWDEPRNRLLGLHGCDVRSYAPVDGNIGVLEDEGAVSVSGDPGCAYGDRRVFGHPSGTFLYLLEERSNLQVFSFAEDGALVHVQEVVDWDMKGATVANAGDHVYVVGVDGILRVFESAESGELTEVASLPLAYGHESVAVTDDDSRVFAWGNGGSSVVDVDDPTRPSLLGAVALAREHPLNTPDCPAATAREDRTAADAFCKNGDGYALEWRDGELAVTDLVADWVPSRHNDYVPDFGLWTPYYGFAASPDGRHAYWTTARNGIAVFERVN